MAFVLIDQFVSIVRDQSVLATKVFCSTDPIFRDHFPGFEIIPGTLLTETMAQAAGWLIAYSREFQVWPFLCLVRSAKFRRFAIPGECLEVAAEIVEMHESLAEARAQVLRGNRRVAEAQLVFDLKPRSTLEMPDSAAFDRWRLETFSRLGGERWLS